MKQKTVINGGSNFCFLKAVRPTRQNDKAADISRTGRIAAGLATLGRSLGQYDLDFIKLFFLTFGGATALVDTDVLLQATAPTL
jgi:hypothetical protein